MHQKKTPKQNNNTPKKEENKIKTPLKSNPKQGCAFPPSAQLHLGSPHTGNPPKATLGQGSQVLITFVISSRASGSCSAAPALVLCRRCEIDEFVSWAGTEKENQRIFEVPPWVENSTSSSLRSSGNKTAPERFFSHEVLLTPRRAEMCDLFRAIFTENMTRRRC